LSRTGKARSRRDHWEEKKQNAGKITRKKDGRVGPRRGVRGGGANEERIAPGKKEIKDPANQRAGGRLEDKGVVARPRKNLADGEGREKGRP